MLKTSLRKISILRFYFLVSSSPNWTLVKNVTLMCLVVVFIIVFNNKTSYSLMQICLIEQSVAI